MGIYPKEFEGSLQEGEKDPEKQDIRLEIKEQKEGRIW